MARELGIHRDTVRRYIDAETPPTRRTPAIPPESASDTIADCAKDISAELRQPILSNLPPARPTLSPPFTPLRFSLTGGQAADAPHAVPLLSGIQAGCVIAAKGYESNSILDFIRAQGRHGGRTAQVQPPGPLGIRRELYRQRNLIELALNKLKQWGRIATRCDRRSIYFLSALYLVASVIWG